MTATYTFDVFSTVDGFGSYNSSGNWGGYWGKQGPEFLNRRLAQYSEEQRLVLGANTFREFMHFLGPGTGISSLPPSRPRQRIVVRRSPKATGGCQTAYRSPLSDTLR